MASKTQYVIAECVDQRDAKRYFPGDEFPNPTRQQLKRLTDAGCLSEDKPDPADLASGGGAAQQQITLPDDLGDLTVPKLRELAETDKIDLGDATRKPEILAAIRKARQARAG
jgi:hypothetical protein